jgi:ribosomal protein S12 methylthiotransferase accessory factor
VGRALTGGGRVAGSVVGSPRDAVLRLGSSYRSTPPEETLAIATALQPRLGISRVTDITRMDRLGLPVFASVRPRGQALRVHAGKGVRPLDAQVGALMEAVEYAAAEPKRSIWAPVRLTMGELVSQFPPGVRLVDFAPRFGLAIAPEQPVVAVDCEELSSDRRVLLPAELIFVPAEGLGPTSPFGSTTNGLASGNNLQEATLHALLEVMERDAVSMNKPKDASLRVDPRDYPEPFGALAKAWQALGIDLAVRHVPNAFSLPCFEAWLHEHESTSVNLANGSALHLDREVAFARAVCEAAQSRLSHVHGGRDDITRFYAKYDDGDPPRRREEEARLINDVFDETRPCLFDELPHEPTRRTSIAEVLDDLLGRLAQAGFGVVHRHRFRLDLDGLHVVKVVVPKCEDVEIDTRRMGPRLLARVLAGA